MPALSNGRHELFAQELTTGLTADAAYEAAGYRPNRGNAARLKADDSIQARVAELQRRGAERAEASIAGVLRELWAIGVADPNDLIEFRRGCCRHCWGAGFRHQETVGERDRRLAQWKGDRLAAAGDPEKEAAVPEWDARGGVGYDATRGPNAKCPECFGMGIGEAFLKDTRDLQPAARSLYAGVKVTKDGFEVKLQDKVGALTKVGQHLGMFAKTLKIGNEDDKPFETVIRWANSRDEAVRDPAEQESDDEKS